MKTEQENYQQEKVTGTGKQTVIIDSSATAETDELSSSFYASSAIPDPELPEEDEDLLDGEGIDEENHGADPVRTETATEEDPGLNHDDEDDLSLNTGQDEIL